MTYPASGEHGQPESVANPTDVSRVLLGGIT
jgi:hypothetical protein